VEEKWSFKLVKGRDQGAAEDRDLSLAVGPEYVPGLTPDRIIKCYTVIFR
jgi:hypothetical protein